MIVHHRHHRSTSSSSSSFSASSSSSSLFILHLLHLRFRHHRLWHHGYRSLASPSNIRTFLHYLRPVLMIDASAIKWSLYNGQICTVATDGKQSNLPIAFVVLIKEKLKAARDRQKIYADNRRKPLEFEVRDQVMLKVSPWKGVIRFGKKEKLTPRYVGPFEILERIGPVAYRLRLPEKLSGVHDTFHVSNLKKCFADASLHVPLDDINIDKTLCFVEEPVEIMDRKVKSLKRSKIALVKVRWNSKRGPEFTWEREDYMKSKYPQLFVVRADESAS
ncbi:hypothetical protein Tco_0360754 [Tanacetum coccineum]